MAIADAGDTAPRLVQPSGGWSRPALLDWFGTIADDRRDMLIGLDLSPALPFADRGAYFPGWRHSPPDASTLWAMVDALAGTEPDLSVSQVVAHPELGRHFRRHRALGDLFEGGRGRLRICEERQRAAGLSPTSCFNLIGAAQVGKSSLTGMRVLHRLHGRIPVWPFDPVPATGPVIVEIYTTIAARAAGIRPGLSKIRDATTLVEALARLDSRPPGPLARCDDHATDALLTAAWLRTVAATPGLWAPALLTERIAQTEGWTFGVD